MHPAPGFTVTPLTFVHVNISGSGTNVLTDAGAGTQLRGSRTDYANGRIVVVIRPGPGNLRNSGPTMGNQYVIISAEGKIYDAVLEAMLGTGYYKFRK